MTIAIKPWFVTSARLMGHDNQIPGTPLRANPEKIRWSGLAHAITPEIRDIALHYWGVENAEEAEWGKRPGLLTPKQIATLQAQLSRQALAPCTYENKTIHDHDAQMLEAIGFDYRHVWCLPEGHYILRNDEDEKLKTITINLKLHRHRAEVNIRFIRTNAPSIYWQANSLTVFNSTFTDVVQAAGSMGVEQIISLPGLEIPIRKIFNTDEGHTVFAAKKSTHLTKRKKAQ